MKTFNDKINNILCFIDRLSATQDISRWDHLLEGVRYDPLEQRLVSSKQNWIKELKIAPSDRDLSNTALLLLVGRSPEGSLGALVRKEVHSLRICGNFISDLWDVPYLEGYSNLKSLLLLRLGIHSLKFIEALPKLKHLSIVQASGKGLFKGIRSVSSLQSLRLISWKDFRHFNKAYAFDGLRTLIIDGCELRHLQGLVHLNQLRHLTVKKSGKLKTLEGIEGCTHLRSLRISRCKSLKSLHLGPDNKDLRDLFVSSAPRLQDIAAPEVSTPPNLRNVVLRHCRNLTTLSDLHNAKKLRLVDLQGCLRLKSLDGLEDLKELDTLKIEGCTGLTSLATIASLPKLRFKTLNLAGFTKIESLNGLEGQHELEDLNLNRCKLIKNLDPIQSLSKLRSLNLRNCSGLTSAKAIKGAKNLERLMIRRCFRLKIQFQTLGLKNLKYLELCKTPFNHAGIKGMTKLEIFKLEDVRISSYFLKEIRGARVLYRLDLLRCPVDLNVPKSLWLSPQVVRATLPLAQFVTLFPKAREVVLRYNASTDLKGLSQLVHLRKLKLVGWNKLSDLKELIKLEKIEELTLIGCKSIRDLSDLSGHPGIKKLVLQQCKNIEDLSHLSTLPALEELAFVLLPPRAFKKSPKSLPVRHLYIEKDLSVIKTWNCFTHLTSLTIKGAPYRRGFPQILNKLHFRDQLEKLQIK